MKKSFLCACFALFFLPSLFAKTAPDSTELETLLKDFLAGASQNDAEIHANFWADDLIYTGSTGRRLGKAEIMRDIRAAPAPSPEDPKTVYTAEDIQIQQYGNTAIVAFRLVATTINDGQTEITYYLNSGTFLKRNNIWQAVCWQATKMPAEREEVKK